MDLQSLFPVFLPKTRAGDQSREDYDIQVTQNENNINQNFDILFKSVQELADSQGSQGGTTTQTIVQPDSGGGSSGDMPAASILQAVYPVGAVYLSTVATNPSTLFGFGTWELIGRDFAERYTTALADHVTLNTTNCTSVTGNIMWKPRSIAFSASLTPKVAITDSTLQMFTFDLAKLGITQFVNAAYRSYFSDNGQADVCYYITTAGVFSTLDVMVRGSSTASLAVGQTLRLQFDLPVYWTHKLVAFCDRFYWKRTA